MIPYQVLDWSQVTREEHESETGSTWWRTLQLPGLRIRLVAYSPGCLADHWCRKGHIVHCLKGEFTSELADGTDSVRSGGMTYVVSDGASSHRSRTDHGVVLLIIDDDFLAVGQTET